MELLEQQRTMASVGARLLRPKLMASFSHWLRDWQGEKQAAAAMTQEERFAEQVALRHAAEAEMEAVRAELASASEALQQSHAGFDRLLQDGQQEAKDRQVGRCGCMCMCVRA